MFNIHFTLPLVVSLLRTVVANKGSEHVATRPDGGSGCIYMVHDKNGVLVPVCIVGNMFHNLGLGRLLLTEWSRSRVVTDDTEPENYGGCTIYGETFWNNLGAFGITATDEAKQFLATAQDSQDSGNPWGEAFNEALNEARERVLQRAREAAEAIREEADDLPEPFAV